MILAFDTATKYCSVALKTEEKLYSLSDSSPNGHAQRLMPMISEVLELAKAQPNQLTKIIVSLGPGSFTGLRIGIATALGLASSLNVACYGVSSLRARSYLEGDTICPIIDARRDRIYGACYGVLEIEEMNVAFDEFLQLIQGREVVFTGEGIEAFADRAGVESREHHDYAAGLIEAYLQGHYTNDLTPRYLRSSQAEAEARGEQLP